MTTNANYPDPRDVAALRRLTVLYVEDDAEIRRATVPFLERRVGRVVVAANGREGLECFGVQPIDLVVTDVLMPELNGLDMAEAIRGRAPQVPVIMVTAFERPDFMRRAIEIGVTRYVLKPVDPGRLDEALLHCARQLALEQAREVARQRELELIQARHAAAIGELAAGLAHDYNNLMQAVVGSIDLIEYSVRNGLDAAPILDIAHRGFEQATRLSRQLESLHHGSAGGYRVASIGDTWRPVFEMAVAGVSTELRWEAPAGLPLVRHQPDRMAEVAAVLARNAIESMDGAGVLSVSARDETLAELNPRHLPPGRYVHLTVTDTGPGIAPDLLDRLFDPYATTKARSAAKGVGLNLAIARAVVSVHRGAIAAESWPGQTTFHVLLPVAPADAAVTA